eukprot:13288826-Alexandrium_andersonii.AAC.1
MPDRIPHGPLGFRFVRRGGPRARPGRLAEPLAFASGRRSQGRPSHGGPSFERPRPPGPPRRCLIA